MDRVYWIKHRGKQILYSDYANLGADELIAAVRETDATFSNYRDIPPGTLSALLNFENVTVFREVIATMKTSATLWSPLYKRQAVIGLSPLHHVFLSAVNKFSKLDFTPFRTREEALEWLTSD